MITSPLQPFDVDLDIDVAVRGDWELRAACRGRLELFFPRRAERPQARARREAKAKRLCDACPVVDECRSTARNNREYGFWAGESEEDRHVLGFRVTAPIGVRARANDRVNSRANDEDQRHLRST